MSNANHSKRQAAVAAQLAALEAMDNAALRAEWRRLYRVAPPRRVRRDLLLLAVAWKVQERALGGLSAGTRRKFDMLAEEGDPEAKSSVARRPRLKPGARLIRDWQGRTHTVTVTEDGFLWNDREWRSLSRIAREITGSHWSGPRFFGLTGKADAAAPAPDHD